MKKIVLVLIWWSLNSQAAITAYVVPKVDPDSNQEQITELVLQTRTELHPTMGKDSLTFDLSSLGGERQDVYIGRETVKVLKSLEIVSLLVDESWLSGLSPGGMYLVYYGGKLVRLDILESILSLNKASSLKLLSIFANHRSCAQQVHVDLMSMRNAD